MIVSILIPFVYSLLLFGIFYTFYFLRQRYHLKYFNPFYLSVITIVILIQFFSINIVTFENGTTYITYLLQPAVVAMAYPLYERRLILVRYFKSIILLCTGCAFISAISTFSLAYLLNLDKQLAVSLMPRAVTAPIAIAITKSLGGHPSITVAAVLFSAIFTSFFYYSVVDKLNITSKMIRGVGIGATAHVIGATKASSKDAEEFAFAVVSFILCGIITSVVSVYCVHLSLMIVKLL